MGRWLNLRRELPTVAPSPALAAGWSRLVYDSATSCPMAHKKAAISCAIAATTTGGFLPAALRRR